MLQRYPRSFFWDFCIRSRYRSPAMKPFSSETHAVPVQPHSDCFLRFWLNYLVDRTWGDKLSSHLPAFWVSPDSYLFRLDPLFNTFLTCNDSRARCPLSFTSAIFVIYLLPMVSYIYCPGIRFFYVLFAHTCKGLATLPSV